MMMNKTNGQTGDAWYALSGRNSNVVVSTRAVLSRNLANFPFPPVLNNSDAEHIVSLVVDAFNFLPQTELFQSVPLSKLDADGTKVMVEREIFDVPDDRGALILRTDGRVSCTVNLKDHVKIAAFSSGFELDESVRLAREIDFELQKKLQFAASLDFGYLNTNILDSGSGMKLLVRVHLPALSILKKIRGLSVNLNAQGLIIASSFGAGFTGASLGDYYDIYTKSSAAGSEFEQCTTLVTEINNLIEFEEQNRITCAKEFNSEFRNRLYRSIALVKNSLFISIKEAVEIVGNVKTGFDLGFLSGIENNTLHALLYRIQSGHLEYLLKNGDFSFEEDIKDNQIKKIDRLRTLVLQEAFSEIKLKV